MRHEIVLAPEAAEDLKRLPARSRAIAKAAMETHLRHEPGRVSKSQKTLPASGSHTGGQNRMKTVPLSEIKDDLSRYLRIAEREQVVITRHGKPAGLLVGFASEEDWFDYKLENDPRFLQRIESARRNLAAERGVRLEDVSARPRRPRRAG